MTVIPCERDASAPRADRALRRDPEDPGPSPGRPRLSETGFLQLAVFRGAIEKMRGEYSATHAGQARVRAACAEPPGGRRLHRRMGPRREAGPATTTRAAEQRPSCRHRPEGLPGREQHQRFRTAGRRGRVRRLERLHQRRRRPAANAWSGIHTRLGAEMIAAVSESTA